MSDPMTTPTPRTEPDTRDSVPTCLCAQYYEDHHLECPVLRHVVDLTTRLTRAEQRADEAEARAMFEYEVAEEARVRFADLANRHVALTADLAAARKDAERYRYIRSRAVVYDYDAQQVGFAFPWKSLTVGDPSTLDAAIDAARAAEGGATT